VTNQEAREILSRYRPGIDDADPQFAEAIELAQRDPELSRQLEQQAALHASIRAKFKQVPVPAGLKAAILAEKPGAAASRFTGNSLWILAAAACVAAAVTLAVLFLPGNKPDNNFVEYRQRVVDMIARGYTMKVVSPDWSVLTAAFKAEQAPSEFSVPKQFDQLGLLGGSTVPWYSRTAAMVCYSSGGGTNNVWLAVAARDKFSKLPPASPPQLEDFNGYLGSSYATASWISGKLVYTVVVKDKDDLKKLLPQ
jgi:hypothetical protein